MYLAYVTYAFILCVYVTYVFRLIIYVTYVFSLKVLLYKEYLNFQGTNMAHLNNLSNPNRVHTKSQCYLPIFYSLPK